MAVARKRLYTPQEYLAMEQESEIRHEFINGEIYAISGGTAAHNRIAVNLTLSIESALRKAKSPCSVFVNDLKVRIKRPNIYTYPDLMVICGKLEFDAGRKDVVLNPTLIIEVSSHSTSRYDHTRKFAAYRQIPSLEEYVMVEQGHVYVECFRKNKSKLWVLEAFENLDETLRLQSVGVDVPLKAIYEQVDLAEEG